MGIWDKFVTLEKVITLRKIRDILLIIVIAAF